jgi:hypothetical protein
MPIIESFPEFAPTPSTTSRLSFTFDILPNGYNDLAREIWRPRLKVDGVEIRIKGKAVVDEGEDYAGSTLAVNLQKVSDKAAFTSSAVIEFGIGRRISGAWDEATFVPLLTDGEFRSLRHSISGPLHNLKDQVSITIFSKTASKLNKTSETGLIIYDSDRTQINDSDLETIYDKDGNAYTPEVLAIPGLKLSHLSQEVFVTRCGFSGVRSPSIPANDYPILRYQVSMGQRFLEGFSSSIGMYRPAFRDIDDVLWISDTTLPQPSGFPAPRSVTVDRLTNIDISREPQKLDALLLHFIGLENNYDFTTFKFEYPTSSRGRTTTETERITIEFRKITSPTTNVIVREALNIENNRTLFDGNETDNSSNVYEFDSNGRISHRRNTVQKLLPDSGLGYAAFAMQTALVETEEYSHRAHPFKPGSEFVERRTYRKEGLVAIDNVNRLPNGSPFVMEYVTAVRSNQVTEDTELDVAPFRFAEETAEPLRDGNVRVREFEIDELTGLVIKDHAEDRAGEISVNGGSSVEKIIPVFAEDNATRSLDRTETMSIDSLPLKYGIPLAKRVLVRKQQTDGTIDLAYIGYDAALAKGVPIAPKDRDGNSLGNVLIVGRRIEIDDQGLVMVLQTREIVATDEPLQQMSSLENYATTIDEGAALVFTVPIACGDGFSLQIDPSTLSLLKVEARHVELPALAWTDLETANIDLSPWDGDVENFEIRVTSDVGITNIERVSFDLLTAE